ncbi:MAG: GGDEF domain-containing protein, partial [Acidimicrobiales bacterium]
MIRSKDMVFKRALPIVLVVASGGVAIAGWVAGNRYSSAITFFLAALAVLAVYGTSSSRRRSVESAQGDLPVTSAPEQEAHPEARPVVELPVVMTSETTEELGITDQVTGMMNHLFFAGLIGTKVATARRRLWPVSIVLLHVSFTPHGSTREQENIALAEFAKIIESTLRDADVPCRIATRTFGLILDDTDEDGAAWAAERIQLAQARRSDSVIVKVSAGFAS